MLHGSTSLHLGSFIGLDLADPDPALNLWAR